MSTEKYQKIESKISSWLALHLDFIETGLSLIKTEFALSDNWGSKGYIDILAKDRYANFVIIEVKRSDNSARQTFTEILKYHALIKQKYKAKDGEIRMIVVSTHWAELIRAFSELRRRTTYALQGFEIGIDSVTAQPLTIQEKQPLPLAVLDRIFVRQYALALFLTAEKRATFQNVVQLQCRQANMVDYVLLDMEALQEICYPYATIVAFQKLSDEELLAKIHSLNSDFEDDRDGFDTDDEYTHYLEEELLIALCKGSPYDTMECGFPEKIDAELSQEHWTVSKIHRYGLFEEDPRYDDEILLREIRGLEGNSRERYFFVAESTQPERIKEMIEKCVVCLENSSDWQAFILFRLQQILLRKERVRVGLYIYNPVSTLQALVFAITKNVSDYMPCYQLMISSIDDTTCEIFWGDIAWNGEKSHYSLFSKYKSQSDILTDIYFGMIQEEMVLYRSNLYFSNQRLLLEAGKEKQITLIKLNDDENEIILDPRPKKSLHDFFQYKPNILDELIQAYAIYSK